jgi:plastocyanin
LTRATGTAIALTLILTSSACGGGDSPAAPNPPANTFRITIGANGVASPAELLVPPGTRVLFINNHGAPHNMTSDPHPEHDLCPELNQVGLLRPGEFRETGNLNTVRTCGFHDHDDPSDRNLQGNIVIR